MKTPFKMKGFSGFGKSPLNKKTDKVPTAGSTDGVTAGDIETSKEEAERSLGQRGNVVDVLKRRKRKVTPGEKAKPKFRLSVGTLTDGTKEYFKIDSEGNKTKISKATYNSLKGK